jgi:hypothetical protein
MEDASGDFVSGRTDQTIDRERNKGETKRCKEAVADEDYRNRDGKVNEGGWWKGVDEIGLGDCLMTEELLEKATESSRLDGGGGGRPTRGGEIFTGQ